MLQSLMQLMYSNCLALPFLPSCRENWCMSEKTWSLDCRKSTKSLPASLRVFGAVSKWVAGVPRNKDGTIKRRLADILELRVPANAKPTKGVYTKDVTLDAETKLWVRLFIPVTAGSSDQKAARQFPLVFYFHGGGFSLLSPDFIMYDHFCRTLARHSQVRLISEALWAAHTFRFQK